MKRSKIVLKTILMIDITMIIIAISQATNNLKVNENNNQVQQINIVKQVNLEQKDLSESLSKEQSLKELSLKESSLKQANIQTYKKGEKNLKIPILIYHAFQTPIPQNDKYNLFSTQERFEENVKTLLNSGYTFITLEDIYKYDKGEIGLPEKNITITMDDGWLGCYTEAFPILKKYNIPATIFIVDNLVGTGGYFSWDQAREMHNTGLIKIYAHGRKHVEATGYSKEKLIEAYNYTHQKIEKELGAKVPKIMAYPSGKSSPNTVKWLKEAGFEVQVQTKYGTINKTQTLNLTGLGRIRGEKATGKNILKQIM